MKYTDIAIIGGGLAGATAAAMLGRAGIATVLVDPHPVYPPSLRCEKLSGHEQLERFRRTGIAESTLRAATHDGENWIARFGYLLDKRPSQQYGIMYDTLVNAVRAEIPPGVEQIYAKAIAISASAERQKVTLSNGEEISARLVVLANGLNVGLLHKLGIRREVVSTCHSITLGFDVVPAGPAAFGFPALTYFSERPSDLIPYVTMFPIGKRMRANLFCYRQMDDPWLSEMRRAPEATLNKSLPKLRRIVGDFRISGDIKIRPADLYVTSGHLQPGVVMVGDAFETTCPVTGTGTDKLFTDVERLCNHYLSDWLTTDGMALDKIAAFYDDPVKQQCDAWSMAKAYNFRSLSIDRGFYWRAQRWARFFAWLGEGLVRRMRDRFNAPPAFRTQSSSSSSSLSPSA
jgi:2-polyprenyl-6-methoxyphenol hydroxylase-like FAD-dependent oxidoreductase